MTGHIRWHDEIPGNSDVYDVYDFACTGYVGTVKEPAFIIYTPDDLHADWLLSVRLTPGGQFFYADSPGKLKAEAERWLEGFVSSLGAAFPEGDAIVRWQEVRGGDLVLLNDTLVTAELVTICQKPWGDGTTFTAADVSYRLGNGVRVISECHGDRYTAVRRPVAEAAAKPGEEA